MGVTCGSLRAGLSPWNTAETGTRNGFRSNREGTASPALPSSWGRLLPRALHHQTHGAAAGEGGYPAVADLVRCT